MIQDHLKAKGIKINKQAVWSRNHPNDNLIEAIEYFAKNEMTRDRSLDGLPPYMIFKRSQEIKAAKEAAAAEGREYVPGEEKMSLDEAKKQLAEQKQQEGLVAQAEAEAAEAAAREAQEAAEAAAAEAAEAARLAAEKARAAAQAAEEAAADASDGEASTTKEDE